MNDVDFTIEPDMSNFIRAKDIHTIFSKLTFKLTYDVNTPPDELNYSNNIKGDPFLIIYRNTNTSETERFMHIGVENVNKKYDNYNLKYNNFQKLIRNYLCNKLWLELKEKDELFKYDILVKTHKKFGKFNVLCYYTQLDNLDVKHALIKNKYLHANKLIQYIDSNIDEIKQFCNICPYAKINIIKSFAKNNKIGELRKKKYKWIIKDIDKIQKIIILQLNNNKFINADDKKYSIQRLLTKHCKLCNNTINCTIFNKYNKSKELFDSLGDFVKYKDEIRSCTKRFKVKHRVTIVMRLKNINDIITLFNYKDCTIDLNTKTGYQLISICDKITSVKNFKIKFETSSIHYYYNVKYHYNNQNMTVSIRNSDYKNFNRMITQILKITKLNNIMPDSVRLKYKNLLYTIRDEILNSNNLEPKQKSKLESKVMKCMLILI